MKNVPTFVSRGIHYPTPDQFLKVFLKFSVAGWFGVIDTVEAFSRAIVHLKCVAFHLSLYLFYSLV